MSTLNHAHSLVTAPCRLPATLLRIARSLQQPMRAKRSKILPVSRQRRFHIWEFQALADASVQTIIALDVRERSIVAWKRERCIVAWKRVEGSFETVVEDYEQRIARRPSSIALPEAEAQRSLNASPGTGNDSF